MSPARSLTLLTVLLLGTALPTRADTLNGAELLALCDTPKSDSMVYFTNFSLCIGYVNGVSDASTCGNQVNGASHANPKGTTLGAVLETFVTWMRAHPDQTGQGAAVLVARSLAEAYPCP